MLGFLDLVGNPLSEPKSKQLLGNTDSATSLTS